MRVRTIVLALLVAWTLAPSALAAQPCGEAICTSIGSTRQGAGSCDAGGPSYSEAHDATLIVGPLRNTYVSLYSDCYREDADGGSEGHRELGAGAQLGRQGVSVVWSESEHQGASSCRMRMDGAARQSAPCVAGSPPQLPTTPGDTGG
ncbi:MAG TPA: hypothetical protein VM370_04730 [Candidatus Thermoplasmatota archaeon]|nr:hypothetical protein [Candidatus Thermoplasmatota archaeon]